MSTYAFTPHERFAVFSVHGEKCYLCRKPLDLRTMEVDHIVPESLGNDPPALREVLDRLGLFPDTFSLNSYENWAPACGPCNRGKSDRVFRPSLEFQLALELAEERAPKAREHAAKTVNDQALGQALNALERRVAEGHLEEETASLVLALAKEIDRLRVKRQQGAALRLTPMDAVWFGKAGVQVVRGPYGVGGGTPEASSQARCGCGSPYFSGARCVMCGTMSDD